MIRPATKEAYQLLHDGAIALAQVEAAGIRVDVDYVDRTMEKLSRRIKNLGIKLREDAIYKGIWEKKYRGKSKLSSKDQLAYVFFDVLKYPVRNYTPSGDRPSADEGAFEGIDHPFVRRYFKREKLKKARDTFLAGIRREVVEGFLHSNFNLNIARSYRSTADSPNSQQWPIRDWEMAELIRCSFIARSKDHVLVEIDYGQQEVKTAACYNHDPQLLKYCRDKTRDMHRDMAMQCFGLDDLPEDMRPAPEWWKQKGPGGGADPRYCAKNMFVFPQFYGDYYINNAAAMWEAMDRLDIRTPDGTSMRDHLAGLGIDSLGECDPKLRPEKGTYEKHIKDVQEDFWGRRFKVYKQWKEEWWEEYQQTGGVSMLTGFRVEGVYNRKQIINLPIQGSAFHCLLWSLIRIVKRMKKLRMKSRIVSQVHDSIWGDIHIKELPDFLAIAKEIMIDALMRAWDWIIVPLEIEAEVAPQGMSLFHKQKVAIP